MSTQENEFKLSLGGLAEGNHDPHDYLALIGDLSSSNSTQDPSWAIQHAKEIAASENPQAEIQKYVELVLSTRTKVEDDHELDTKLITAASNAISILNYGSLLGLFDFQMVYVRDWSRCRFPEADLSFAALGNCVFDDADLSRVTLWGANLHGTNLQRSKLSHASPALMHPEVVRTLLDIFESLRKHPAEPCMLPGWVSSDGKILLKALNPVRLDDCANFVTYESLEVWNLTEQEVLFTLPHGNFSCAALSPNGSVLVYAESVEQRVDEDEQPNLHVYEVVPGGRAITTISVPFAKVPKPREGITQWDHGVVEVRNATYNHDGSKLAVVSLAVATEDYHGVCDFCHWRDSVTYRSLIVILDTRKGFNVTAEIPVDDRVTSVVFSQDSSLLVCTTERRVMCWNTDGWECKCNQGYDEDVACVGFVPYAAQLAVVLKNGSVHVCDLVETVSDPIPTADDGSYTAPTPPGEGKDDADKRSMEYPSVSAAQLRKLFEQGESCDYVINALATACFGAAPRFGIDVWKFLQWLSVELPFPHESLGISSIPGTTAYFYLDAKARLLNRADLCDLLRWSLRMASHVNANGSSSGTN